MALSDGVAQGATLRVGEARVPIIGSARVYVCGITPYDTTHLGHAATFVWTDLVARVFLCVPRMPSKLSTWTFSRGTIQAKMSHGTLFSLHCLRPRSSSGPPLSW